MRVGNETPVRAQAAEADQRFRRAAVAFEVLKDGPRRETYHKHGFVGLKRFESHSAVSLLDTLPYARFDAFFEGTDAGDREYLLLEAVGAGRFSDDDGGGEVTENEHDSDDSDDDDDDEVPRSESNRQ